MAVLFSSFGFSQKSASDENITRLIIVRHAEKSNDGTKDPSLSEIGKARAEKLKLMLSEFKIEKLFSTPYLRTTQTLQPIAASNNLEINNYNPGDQNFAKNLILGEKGKTIVISGHSNTCPQLANSLLNAQKYKDIDEADYGKIWIITYKNEKLHDCILLNY